jgi:hypothetical protein
MSAMLNIKTRKAIIRRNASYCCIISSCNILHGPLSLPPHVSWSVRVDININPEERKPDIYPTPLDFERKMP